MIMSTRSYMSRDCSYIACVLCKCLFFIGLNPPRTGHSTASCRIPSRRSNVPQRYLRESSPEIRRSKTPHRMDEPPTVRRPSRILADLRLNYWSSPQSVHPMTSHSPAPPSSLVCQSQRVGSATIVQAPCSRTPLPLAPLAGFVEMVRLRKPRKARTTVRQPRCRPQTRLPHLHKHTDRLNRVALQIAPCPSQLSARDPDSLTPTEESFL